MSATRDWDKDRVDEMALEIIDSFTFCADNYPEFEIDPFYTKNKNDKSILHKTKCVASMTSAAIIMEMALQAEEDWIESLIRGLKPILDNVPEKQTGKTVWDYHLSVVKYLTESAKVKGIDIESLADGRFLKLAEAK